MSWQTITVLLPREQVDAFGDALLEAGAVSVNVEDADEGTDQERPIFGEPGASAGLWNQCRLGALFDADLMVGEAIGAAAKSIGIRPPDFTVSELENIDWVAKNREQFQPIRISDRTWIVPTWHHAPDADAVNIALDPGAAFGTGSHPTTRLCLQWLEQEIPQLKRPSVIDYGCGSGILAIAAAKYGAGAIWGVDIDPQAVDAARYNADKNQVAIHFQAGDQALDAVADILVANILANPLRVLAPLLAAHVRPGGHLALAGILDQQADELIRIYQPWFDISVWRQDEGWSCLAGTRRGVG